MPSSPDIYNLPTRTNPETGKPAHQTIFPRINFLKNFEARFTQRAENGRIYLNAHSIDDIRFYKPEPGALAFSDSLPFPVDLGPDVTSAPTTLFDLRQDDGVPAVIDMNPL